MSSNDFVVDQFVVYPSHGVGKITAIEEQETKHGTLQQIIQKPRF